MQQNYEEKKELDCTMLQDSREEFRVLVLRLRRIALQRLLLHGRVLLWAIVLRVVLMFAVLPGVPALTQNVLDALLSDLDLSEERDVSTFPS